MSTDGPLPIGKELSEAWSPPPIQQSIGGAQRCLLPTLGDWDAIDSWHDPGLPHHVVTAGYLALASLSGRRGTDPGRVTYDPAARQLVIGLGESPRPIAI